MVFTGIDSEEEEYYNDAQWEEEMGIAEDKEIEEKEKLANIEQEDSRMKWWSINGFNGEDTLKPTFRVYSNGESVFLWMQFIVFGLGVLKVMVKFKCHCMFESWYL